MAVGRGSAGWAENARFAILLLLLGACFLFGGASRLDVPSLVILQPLAVLCAAAFVILPGPMRWGDAKTPLLLLGALAVLMAVQLIPLPPAIWASLPGRAPFAEIASAAGIGQPWRPLTLTPDLTLASLVGLIVPFAAIVGFVSIPVERTYRLLPFILAFVGLGMVIGIGQITGGPRSLFYFYAITNSDSPVGFFSNRNHQAILLAMAWPMLALWATMPHGGEHRDLRLWIAGAAAIFVLPMLVATGSRGGLAAGLIGLIFAVLQWRARVKVQSRLDPRLMRVIKWVAVAVAVVVVVAMLLASRDEAIRRSLTTSIDDEMRLRALPVVIRMIWDFFPLGAGFGSFDPTFRFYEPFDLLRPTYFNHAHNDLTEVVLEGGLPAVAILATFLFWVGRKASGFLWRRGVSRVEGFGRLGAAMITIVFFSSLLDYPLRTPLLATLIALASCWLAVPPRPREEG